MNLPPWTAFVGIVLAVGAFTAGRYSAPTRVETKYETVERLRVETTMHVHRVLDTRTQWRTVTTSHPDGSTEKTEIGITETHENTKAAETTKTETDVHTVRNTQKISDAPRVTILGLVGVGGVDLTKPQSIGVSARPVFGAALSYRVAGPLTVGVFGVSNGTLGAALGLTL